jgi:hypothetical protein
LNTSRECESVLETLHPHLLGATETPNWPGTTLLDGTATVRRYRLEPSVVDIVSNAVESLYAWQQPERPEDLCLLRADGDPWLVTVAHEGDAYVVVEADELDVVRREAPELAAILVAEEPGFR